MVDYVLEKEVKLLSMNGITELKTGEFAVAANFGEVIENTPEVANRLDRGSENNPSGPKEIGFAEIIISLRLDDAKPFSVGTKYKLRVDKDANISLTKE